MRRHGPSFVIFLKYQANQTTQLASQSLRRYYDGTIFGRTVEEHNTNLVEILFRIQRNDFTLNPKKCFFLCESED